MFDRYNETARRAIFFARYKASNFGSAVIDTHHLLLGALREDKTISRLLPVETIRRQLEKTFPRGAKIRLSVDLPLSHDSKRALAFGAEEAEMLQHEQIYPGHLLLGLLRVETSPAAEMLRENGITLETLRGLVGETPPPMGPIEFTHSDPAASLKPAIDKLEDLVNRAESRLCMFSAADTYRALAQKARIRRRGRAKKRWDIYWIGPPLIISGSPAR